LSGYAYKKDLNPDKALIFRITHRDNVPWILAHGLVCRNGEPQDPRFVTIGSRELIGKREHREVPIKPGGTLADYVPFYFTPFSPMLYNIKTGRGVPQRDNEEIVILVSSLYRIAALGHDFVFTDRHAYLRAARYFSGLNELSQLNWDSLQRRNFRRDPEDLEAFDRYQAEALVHRIVPAEALLGAVAYSNEVTTTIQDVCEQRELNLKVIRKPGWYF
jgi:hypothetical protein